MIAQSKPEFAITPVDICRLLFRHKAKVIFCFAVSMCAAIAVVLFWPRRYKSESKLFVHIGRESVTLDPTATTSTVIPVSLSREPEVGSVLEMLRSRVIFEKLVDELGPDAILRPADAAATEREQSASLPSGLASWINLDPVSDREKAISYVSKCIASEIEKKSDVITVSGTAGSPELAQRIVAKYVDIYLGEHTKMHRTAGSQAFFTVQTALLRKNLSDALAKLRDVKNQFGIFSVESQRQILQNEMIEVETRLAKSRSGLAAARKKTKTLDSQLQGLPERLATDETAGFANGAADNMRGEMYRLEVREAELASRFTDKFPQLVAVREQIKTAKNPLSAEEKRRTQSSTSHNVVHSQMQLSLLNEESNAESLDAETLALYEQLAKLNERARLLNDQEAQIADLEQEAALCKTNYATYSAKAEETRIDTALQNERITNVNVVQPASLVGKPTSPLKAMVMALGLFGGLALSIGIALLAEHFNPSIKSAGDVENQLSLPLLVAIPRVAQRHAVLK